MSRFRALWVMIMAGIALLLVVLWSLPLYAVHEARQSLTAAELMAQAEARRVEILVPALGGLDSFLRYETARSHN